MINGPHHVKTSPWAYADSEGPDQTAHPRSLIRAFPVRWENHWILQNVWMESIDVESTLKRRVISTLCSGHCNTTNFIRFKWYENYYFRPIFSQYQRETSH